MEEGLIDQYHDQLLAATRASEYHLILNQIFYKLFNRTFNKTESMGIGKLVNLYGKMVVFEAMIRASMVSTFNASRDSNSVGYLYKICQRIHEENKDSLKEVERVRQIKNETQDLLKELSKPQKKFKLKERDF